MNSKADTTKKSSAILRWFATAKPLIITVLAWIYAICCFYISIGIIMFPQWWKRALVKGDVFHAEFVRRGFSYLWGLMVEKHPLGNLLPTIAVFFVLCVIFYAGRAGLRGALTRLPRPSNTWLTFGTVVLLGMVITFRWIGDDLRTNQQLENYVRNLREELEAPYEQLVPNSNLKLDPDEPKSGYFLYLDIPRINSAYGAAQTHLQVASQKVKSGRESALKAQITVPVLNLDASGKIITEEETVRVPPPLTPERQAIELVRLVPPYSFTHSHSDTQAGSSLSLVEWTLKPAGIELTEQQKSQFLAHVVRKFADVKVERGRMIRHSGTATIMREGRSTTVVFRTSQGMVGVSHTAALNDRFLDSLVGESLQKTNRIDMSLRMLSIEAFRSGSGTNYQVTTVPLAIW